MITAKYKHQQQGVVLIIALIMLLVVTVITVSSMRGVTLESNITVTHKQTSDMLDSAEGALREAEYRFYGPAFVFDKTEPVAGNCSDANVLRRQNLNRPCLLDVKTAQLQQFVEDPSVLKNTNIDEFLNGGPELAWMPFRGLDPDHTVVQPATFLSDWNSMLITTSDDENESLNPEYGNTLEGAGTYFYLINARTRFDANDVEGQFFLQSTIANIYIGINN